MRLRTLFISLSLLGAPLLSQAVLNSGNPGGNLTAPTGQDGQPADPGFANMLEISGGAGVYLGNGWVLTARHINPKRVVVNGQTLLREEAIDDIYTFKDAELKLLHLTDEPDLPSMPIASSTPTTGTEVVMIGAGFLAQDHMTGWHVDQSTNPWTWTEVSSPQQANMAGVLTTQPMQRKMSWGTNRMSAVIQNPKMGDMLVTDFSGNPAERTAFEAQAVSRDSGGALFVQGADGWEVAGIMATVARLYPGQPGVGVPEGLKENIIGSGCFGNLTLSVNLASYRAKILEVTGLGKE